MLDLKSRLRLLERPALLVRAARHGVADYRRGRDLKTVLKPKGGVLPSPGGAVMALLDKEEWLDRARQGGDPRYTHQAHVAVLIALMAEAGTVLGGRQ